MQAEGADEPLTKWSAAPPSDRGEAGASHRSGADRHHRAADPGCAADLPLASRGL